MISEELHEELVKSWEGTLAAFIIDYVDSWNMASFYTDQIILQGHGTRQVKINIEDVFGGQYRVTVTCKKAPGEESEE